MRTPQAHIFPATPEEKEEDYQYLLCLMAERKDSGPGDRNHPSEKHLHDEDSNA
jgi:hypothetical protein